MNLIQNLEAAWYYHLGSRHLEANDDHAALANFNRAVNLQPIIIRLGSGEAWLWGT
jgi:hypothetical protein